MDKSFSQFSKVVNKHVLGNQDEFTRLKDKLEMCEHATSKAGAAALGYLMAMEEMEELKSEAGNSVYDQVFEVVNALITCDGQYFAESACDEIFMIFYQWLSENLHAEPSSAFSKDYIGKRLNSLFEEYLMQE
jgi:hypothetical protein